MTRNSSWLMVIIAVVLVALVGDRAISAQDKYALKVPNGLRSPSSRDTKVGRAFLSVITERCLL